MRTFSDATRRLAEYRICLERDVEAGIIPGTASAAVDACYVSLSTMLESARVELEAAGPDAQEQPFMDRFVGSWATLARHMFTAMYRQGDPRDLERTAAHVTGSGRALIEYLWTHIAA
ncbi:MAG: hypothetical protein IIC73_08925 [Armatimonadetes bacterium]|nr:hypothetical protein [Armatimonadota bacterium]